MRENGYYWVKVDKDYQFEPAFKQGKYWLLMGEIDVSEESDFHEINPNRILTPDEMAEKHAKDAKIVAKTIVDNEFKKILSGGE